MQHADPTTEEYVRQLIAQGEYTKALGWLDRMSNIKLKELVPLNDLRMEIIDMTVDS